MSDKNATESLRADPPGVSRAAEILRNEGIVAVPTETVYGLAARADSDLAVAKIYAAKGRPGFNPLIVHVAQMEQAEALAEFSQEARRVAAAVWPGAVTLVLPKRRDAPLADSVSAGLSTIALRMPDHPVMKAVIEEAGTALAAPSANRSNTISPTTADHVAATLDGRIDLILDGGECKKGLESSILAIRQDGTWEELRPGPIDLDLLHQHFHGAPMPSATAKGGIEAPGQLKRHYSPGKPIRMGATAGKSDEFLIGFGPVASDCTLSAEGDLGEAAARLYACLHEAAQAVQPKIAIASIPAEGVGVAINDRLRRAAA